MPLDPLSQTLSAIADPTRRAILAHLSQGTATVGEIAEPFDISLPAISKHLKVLERAGLVEKGREARFRQRPDKPSSTWVGRRRRPVVRSAGRAIGGVR